MVKGDLIVNADDGRIKTRSRSKQSKFIELACTHQYNVFEIQITNMICVLLDPDQYTIVPATLKIVKVLIDELLSASGVTSAANAASAAMASAAFDDEDGDDDGWEDDDTLDLSLGTTKADLMFFGEGRQKQRDDETHAYLTDFFIRCGRENIANFQQWYGMLTEDEKAKLNELANAAA